MKFGQRSKLAPRFFVSFQIVAKFGLVAYQLALLDSIKVHNIFHVSLLKMYGYDTSHVIDWNAIQVGLEREFKSEPLCIIYMREVVIWN